MGKSKSPSVKRPADSGEPTERGEADRRASYFLSLSIENVRCFGSKQTLDLSDGRGKPARWTVILGINGTGKTTLLQSLVGFEMLPEPKPPLTTIGGFLVCLPTGGTIHRHSGAARTSWHHGPLK